MSPPRRRGVIAALLLLHALASVWSARRESITWDELAHIGAGYSHVVLDDYRLTPVAAPLMKLIAGTSLRSSAPPPPTDHPSWQRADHWTFGRELLDRSDDKARLLFRARLPFIGLSVLLGWAIYRWTREQWGEVAAIAALGLHSLSAELLAHSHYANLDLGMTLLTLVHLWGFLRFCERPTPWHGGWATTTFALAVITKYSFPILAVMDFTIVIVIIARHIRGSTASQLPRLAGRLLLLAEAALLLSWLASWAAFGFRYEDAITPELGQPWTVTRMPNQTEPPRVVLDLYQRHLIPEGFANGLAYISFIPKSRQMAYFDGEVAVGGWWYYLPATALLKTPLPLLALLVIGCAARRLGKREIESLLILAGPIAVYFAIAVTFRVSVGYRHLLPTLPLMMMVAGRGVATLLAGRRGRIAALVLLSWYAFGTIRVAPHFLSYFNELAGGPLHGHRWLADSNCDWGQDLGELERVRKREGIDRIKLSYFGNAVPSEPSAYMLLPGTSCCETSLVKTARVASGDVIAVSVTNLHGVYFKLPGSPIPELQVEVGGVEQTMKLDDFMATLERDQQPFARAGYSILVYRWP